MYSNTHGVPSRSVSGTAGHKQFITHGEEDSRGNYDFDAAAMPQRVLLKMNAAKTALVVCTAPTDEVFAVLVEPKPAGVTSFYAFSAGVHVNVDMLNYAAMGSITKADIGKLNINSHGVKIAQPIFSGAD